PPGQTFPSRGWLVHGAVIQVDEGNRLRRALVGLGSGATKLRVVVWVSDLANHSPGPFYVLDTSTHSSRTATAALSLDPSVGAARVLTDGLDMETNVTEIAAEIADNSSEQSTSSKPAGYWKEKLKQFL